MPVDKNSNTKKNNKKKSLFKNKKQKKLASTSILIHVYSTHNNTIASATDLLGNVIAWSSCGTVGFKGSKKSTPYASTRVGEDVASKAISLGAKECDVIIKGVGVGRQAAVKGIKNAGIKINVLLDKTPVPHGGCKPRRKPKK